MLTIFRQRYAQTWRSVVGWWVAITAVTTMYTAVFNVIGPAKAQAMANMPAELKSALNIADMTSGAGFIGTVILSLVGLVLACVAGLGWGANGIAGEEDRGNLTMTLAHAVSRRAVLWQTALAVGSWVVGMGVCIAVVLLIQDEPQRLQIGVGGIVAGVTAMTILVLFYSSLALCVGAATGDRGVAVAASAAVAVLADVLHGFGGTVSWLQPLQPVSPMHLVYGNDPLVNGLDFPGVTTVVCLTLIALFVADVVFARRDLRG